MLSHDGRADRALSALTDVVAVEDHAPGMVRVVTASNVYVVDARHERCECPDQEYHLDEDERCKHQWAALLATDQLDVPAGASLVDDLEQGPEPLPDFESYDPEVEYV